MAEVRSDKDWVRQSFLLPRRAISDRDVRGRVFTGGWNKFSDTTLGGNQAINPAPQFCRYTDVNEERFKQAGKGMGRYYSEVIDENAVILNVRFGIPMFNSLTQFFGNFYNSEASSMARTGRGTSLAYKITRLAGSVAQLRLMPIIVVFQMFKFMIDRPSTKYYYLKPEMGSYWNSVSGVLNTIAANMGFVANMGVGDTAKGNSPGPEMGEKADWESLLPDIYRSDGSLNIYAVGTRYQRLADYRYQAMAEAVEKAVNPLDLSRRVSSIYKDPAMYTERPSNFKNADAYLDAYFNTAAGNFDPPPTSTGPATPEKAPDTQEDISKVIKKEETSDAYFEASMGDFLLAEMRDGAQFISLRVDNPGASSESFSSSVKESSIASTINGASNTARDFRFNFANGNIGSGVISTALETAAKFATDVITGVMDSVGASGLATLFGNGLVDIPKYWDSSSASLPRANFTIELRSPYGNDLSRFQNLMVPVAMLLAGALPRSTGFSSYTSPYICEFFCKGRVQSRLAMIDSLEITRGTGNCGYTSDGKPLGIDINLSFVDMSSVMHMAQVQSFNPLGMLYGPTEFLSKYMFSDDNVFSDYLATLSSLGLSDQIYTPRKLKRRFNTNVLKFKDWSSQAHFASWVSNGGILFGIRAGRIASAIAQAGETTTN